MFQVARTIVLPNLQTARMVHRMWAVNGEPSLLTYIIATIVGGIAGAVAMNAFMRFVGRKHSHEVNMVEAVGSMLTGSLKRALPVGSVIHIIVGVIFAAAYIWIFSRGEVFTLPATMILGAPIGLVHGMIVGYVLMFYAAKNHPLERYRSVTLAIAVIHMAGHVVYGVVLGLCAGIVFTIA